MGDLRTQALQVLLAEQQEQISHLQKVSSLLARETLSIREHLEFVRREQGVLCSCLQASGILKWEGDADAQQEASCSASALGRLLAAPALARAVTRAAGSAAEFSLCLASRFCMEALSQMFLAMVTEPVAIADEGGHGRPVEGSDFGVPDDDDIAAQDHQPEALPPEPAQGEWEGQRSIVLANASRRPASDILSADVCICLSALVGNVAAARLHTSSRAFSRGIQRHRGLFVCGGFDGTALLNSVEAYDPDNGTWLVMPSMTGRRRGACAAVLGGELFVCGGVAAGSPLATGERFNPASGAWRALPPMRCPRRDALALAVRGRLYICGGALGEEELCCVESFRPSWEHWEIRPPMLEPRQQAGAVSLGECIYLCGGGGAAGGAKSSAERLCPGDASWRRLPDMHEARCLPALAAVAGCVYACGGQGAEGRQLTAVERFCQSAGEWQRLPHMRHCRSRAMVAADTAGRIYVCGGCSRSRVLGAVERFSPARNAWETLQDMRHRRASAVIAVVAGEIYVCGGDGGPGALSSAERFDPRTGMWLRLPPMLHRRIDGSGRFVAY